MKLKGEEWRHVCESIVEVVFRRDEMATLGLVLRLRRSCGIYPPRVVDPLRFRFAERRGVGEKINCREPWNTKIAVTVVRRFVLGGCDERAIREFEDPCGCDGWEGTFLGHFVKKENEWREAVEGRRKGKEDAAGEREKDERRTGEPGMFNESGIGEGRELALLRARCWVAIRAWLRSGRAQGRFDASDARRETIRGMKLHFEIRISPFFRFPCGRSPRYGGRSPSDLHSVIRKRSPLGALLSFSAALPRSGTRQSVRRFPPTCSSHWRNSC